LTRFIPTPPDPAAAAAALKRERPLSPHEEFLAYLCTVLDENTPEQYRLGRCRESIATRMNRLMWRDIPIPVVFYDLMMDCGGSTGIRLTLEPDQALARMKIRLWNELNGRAA
jgi:hypothetical protein